MTRLLVRLGTFWDHNHTLKSIKNKKNQKKQKKQKNKNFVIRYT
jgi:hypothetical protein